MRVSGWRTEGGILLSHGRVDLLLFLLHQLVAVDVLLRVLVMGVVDAVPGRRGAGVLIAAAVAPGVVYDPGAAYNK